MPKPKAWTCNACGKEGSSSKEHLIHIAIGRVILKDRTLSPGRVREELRMRGKFGAFPNTNHAMQGLPAKRSMPLETAQIKRLICERL
jgi:hypothetical protein